MKKLLSIFVVGFFSMAGVAGAIEPVSEDQGVETTDTTTTVPNEPGGEVAPSSTQAPTTLSPTSTTTSTTTTTMPDHRIEPDRSGFIFLPGAVIDYSPDAAPLIPDAKTDPLFHAARSVDAAKFALEVARGDLASKKKVVKEKKKLLESAKTSLKEEKRKSKKSEEKLLASGELMRAIALSAYVRPADSIEDKIDVVYMDISMDDADKQLEKAQAQNDDALKTWTAALQKEKTARVASERAQVTQESAASKVKTAEAHLKAEGELLEEQIRLDEKLQGERTNLTRLPDVKENPDGSTGIETPNGTIIIPREVNPRTIIAMQYIVNQLGKPYLWGGAGPDRFDCSGLMIRGFQAAGAIGMPRVSQAQQIWAIPVPIERVQLGDLVFFGTPAYHVGVYIGNGLMINAPFTGSTVRIESIVGRNITGFGRARWPET